MENYQTRVTPAKEDAVAALRDEFKDYSGFIFTDYRGMTVQQITDIRKALKKDEAAYRVVKNRYAKIALKDLDRTGAEEQMKGPTAVALVKGDTANTVAKVLFNANKDGVSIQVKGALLDGKFMSAEEVEALSKLPTKLELQEELVDYPALHKLVAKILLVCAGKNTEGSKIILILFQRAPFRPD